METTKNQLQDEFLAALQANSVRLEEALSTELARPIEPQEGDAVYFEIHADGYSVACCDTEECVLPDFWLDDSLPMGWFDRAYNSEVDLDKLITVPLFNWFAEKWEKVGGLDTHASAYMFYHGCNHELYDLREHCWLPPGTPFRGAMG